MPKCFHGEAAEQKRVNKSGANQGAPKGSISASDGSKQICAVAAPGAAHLFVCMWHYLLARSCQLTLVKPPVSHSWIAYTAHCWLLCSCRALLLALRPPRWPPPRG